MKSHDYLFNRKMKPPLKFNLAGVNCLLYMYSSIHVYTRIFEWAVDENLSAFHEMTLNHGFYGPDKV